MIQSILDMYQEGGRLPKWELGGMETDVMVGDPVVIVIADTYLRGIRDFDVDLAYEAMKKMRRALFLPLGRDIMNIYKRIYFGTA